MRKNVIKEVKRIMVKKIQHQQKAENLQKNPLLTGKRMNLTEMEGIQGDVLMFVQCVTDHDHGILINLKNLMMKYQRMNL